MRLGDLLAGVPMSVICGDPDLEITELTTDSRKAEKGAAFVAMKGCRADGGDYIQEALDRGAAVILSRRRPEGGVPWVMLSSPRAALPYLAANFYGHPADGLTLLGVTGTNGKTSVTYLLRTILEAAGHRTGLIGTTGAWVGHTPLAAPDRTTPEATELHRLLAEMKRLGCTHVVMEVSSHALLLHRTDGLIFRCGVFTNLTPEHLDFHRDMEHYRAAKERLFRQSRAAILNLDDGAGVWYRARLDCPCLTYSENKNEATLTGKYLRLFPDRVSFEAVTRGQIARVELPIPGSFTIYNAMAALTTGLELGLTLPEMAQSLRGAESVPGRMEPVETGEDFSVLIDYAHTPDALENLLLSTRRSAKGRLLLLFGCGGDRDRSKRPVMGAIASQLADIAVVTSDNPRGEDPETIIEEILSGADGDAVLYREPDRRRAIRMILDMARPGDLVLLAGKGHEHWQEQNGKFLRLDEREEVAAALRERGTAAG
ncbi:MAG: UDP-N-acetylmuramoyl-L-alanyl-D-glutamate--2,6-diaminopimelate ligase [Oscillospiraceae bacterium]|nr:UDP-N-acetylmuramoyl-L-alanyl-D-glutamate--2,6-diaminopimelate ligase [Oscillospiraceae bacterium]